MKIPMPDERAERLLARQKLKMARSAQTYVRGSTVRFYEWLNGSGRSLPTGPTVWIGGDCHYGNLGPVANAEGEVAIQIRDLDQTVLGNPTHDLVRLALSLCSAVRGFALPGIATAQMIEQIVEGYQEGLTRPAREDEDRPPTIKGLLKTSERRRWAHLARERIEDVKPTIPLGKRFWSLSDKERGALEALALGQPVRDLVTRLKSREDDAEIDLVDAAYWVKGCSSLGLLRYAAIVGLKSGKGHWSYALVDLKEAVDPVAPAARGAAMPRDNAERVVAAARALSPYLGTRMLPVRMLGRSLFIRELTPHDLKLEVEQFNRGEAVCAARALAFVVGKAHARQMDAATRADWLATLEQGRRGTCDTPSWLWESVVALAARHEAGYLDHCRRYALAA